MKLSRFALVAVLVLFASQALPVAGAAAPAAPGVAASVVVTVIPPKLPADGGTYSAVVVSLVDSNGNPSAALGSITVFLTSSQTNIVMVPDSVTIAAGKEYALANVTTTATPGSSMVTAHSEGLKTVELDNTLTTVTPSGFPSKLKVFVSPSEYLPRSDAGVVRVEVVDDAGLPSKAISNIPVQITSSNSSIASLDESTLVIPQGSIYVSGTLHTSGTGSAVIAASSTGYSSGTALLTVDKPCTNACGAYQISLKLVPAVLPTDGQLYSALEVGLETQSGTPAVLSTDTVVQLTSDQSEVASVPSLVTIPANSIATLAQITTSALAGVATVTATSTGLVPTTLSVNTIIPAPSNLQAYIAPSASAYSTNGNYPILVVQLQDSSGNPARARQATNIVVTSSNGSLLSSFVTLNIPVGSDYVFDYLHTKGVGASVLTVSSQGLVSSQANLKSIASPLSVKLLLSSTSNSFIFANQTATFTFKIAFVGMPLQNVNVTWGTSGGRVTPVASTTGSSGTVSTVFTPPTFGSYNITASASTAETGPIVASYTLIVAQIPTKAPPSIVQQILGFWYYLVAAAAVVIVAVVYLFRMRRKKQRAEIEAGFEVV
jgi:hypothetical protein